MITEEDLRQIEKKCRAWYPGFEEPFALITEIRRLYAAYEQCRQRFSEIENDMGDDAFRYTLIAAFEPEQ